MRIVYLNPCGQLGGAETSLIEILGSIRATMPEWELHLVLGEDGPLAAEARQCGVRVRVEPFPPALAQIGDSRKHPLKTLFGLLQGAGAALTYRKRLAEILYSARPDLIHTNGFKMHVLGAWAREGSTPLAWHIHDYVSTRRLMSRLLVVFKAACSVAIVNSNSVARDVESVLRGLPTVTVHNAIDTQRFSPDGPALELDRLAGLPVPRRPIVRIGLIATFARWKGHRVFLRALATLPPELDVRGYVIGDAIYQTNDSQWTVTELLKEAADLGLGSRVGFTGFVRDVPGAMRALDIVVHASEQPEPFGMIIIEAMACAKALVASRAGGALELFSEERTALGHVPGDAADLARQLERLVRDQPFRERLGREGRLSVQQSFQRDRLGRQLSEVYGRLCNASTERAAEDPDGDDDRRRQRFKKAV